jgi:biotin operon repressor
MSTKYYRLFDLLKTAGTKGVSPEVCAEKLEFAANSVAPYIHAMRNKFGAEIKSIRSGRTVVRYELVNADSLEGVITQKGKKRGRVAKAATATPNAKPAAVKTKPVKATAPVKTKAVKAKPVKPVKTKAPVVTKSRKVVEDGIAPVLDRDMHISEFSDRELQDLKVALGLD